MIINFWQNIPSPHQSACIRALADAGHTVHLLVAQEEMAERKAMGWSRPDFGATQLIVAPDTARINALLGDTTPHGAVNIISGTRSTELCAEALAAAIAHRAHVGLLVEPPDPRGVAGLLRRVLYAVEARRLRNALDFVLAMGQTGVNWYRGAGYPADKVFHFGYVVETPVVVLPLEHNTVTTLAFVGSLIPLKGVDLLLRALAGLTTYRWRLELIGDGPEREPLRMLAKASGIADRVTFHGILPMSEVMPRLAGADLLVLPSRKDGWGAVVNEALHCGVPVICSDQCGAADLLRAPWRGAVVPTESVPALQSALDRVLRDGPRRVEARQRLRTWAQRITGSAMAAYLLDVLAHVYQDAPHPPPPWHIDDTTIASVE